MIGRIRAGSRAELDALLAEEGVDARLFRQGETLALLVEGPSAEARFLRLLGQRTSTLARILDCLEDVPLVPPELNLQVRETRVRPGLINPAQAPPATTV